MNGWWQHLPEHIDPIAFSLGVVSVRWYAVCFVVGIGAVWIRLIAERNKDSWKVGEREMENLFFRVLIGAFLGARLGYVFWYAPAYFLEYPSQILLPFDPMTGHFIGIAGLSFHGALIGVAIAVFRWVQIRNASFLVWMDRFVSAIPIGILFGRLGNFLNGELWGRNTDMVWGMFFPQAGMMELRHPSQLYEMLGEGVLLYFFLTWIGRKKRHPGILTACFLFGYGAIRFILEYWREPDVQVGLVAGVLSLGQVFSLFLIGFGGIWLWRMTLGRGCPEKNML